MQHLTKEMIEKNLDKPWDWNLMPLVNDVPIETIIEHSGKLLNWFEISKNLMVNKNQKIKNNIEQYLINL